MSTATTREHQNALLTIFREFDRICKKLDIPYVLFAGTMLGAVRHQGFIPWDDDLDVMMLRKDYDRFLREAESVLDGETFFLQKEFSEHWPMFFSKLRLNGTTCLEKYHPKDPDIHQGVYIDIFPCDNAAESGFGRKLQFYASKVVIAKALGARGYDTDSRIKKLFIGACRFLPRTPFLRLVKRMNKPGDTVQSFLGGGSRYEKNIYPRAWFAERVDTVFENGVYPISRYSHELLQQLYGDYMQIPPPEDRACKEHVLLLDLENSYDTYAGYRDGMTFEVYTRSIR